MNAHWLDSVMSCKRRIILGIPLFFSFLFLFLPVYEIDWCISPYLDVVWCNQYLAWPTKSIPKRSQIQLNVK